MTEDKILLVALSRGSMKAFDALYRKYAPRVEQFASVLLVNGGFNKADVDDLMQEVFLKIWQKRQDLADNVNDFNAYLFRMTKNAVLNMLTRHGSDRETFDKLSDLAGHDDIHSNAIADEMAATIRRIVNEMPKEREKVFLMSREEGLPNKEIANKLRISTKTVEYHIGRALSDIRKNLS